MRRLARELDETLRGAKIEKIYQPGDRDIVMALRVPGQGGMRLFLSAHKQFARVHFLADERPENPQEPPMFCMLLRKHLEGGRIASIQQHGWDRVIAFRIEAIDELGDVRVYTLIAEVMGRHSNLILCRAEADGEPLRIIDSIVRVTEAMSRHREVVPGAPYIAPPEQHKQPLEELPPTAFAGIDATNWLSRANAMFIVDRVAGVGPVSAREILHRASLRCERQPEESPSEAVLAEARTVIDCAVHMSEAASVALDDMGRAMECAPFSLTHRTSYAPCPSMSEAIRRRFADTGEVLYHSHLQDELQRAVMEHLDKLRGKRVKLEESRAESEDEGVYRVKAELLTAFAHEFAKGDTSVVLPNYYQDNEPMLIELDPALDPIGNAQRYFKMASKRKRAASSVMEQLEATERDIRYLEEVMESLRDASLENLEQVRAELIGQGFLQEKPTKRKRNTGRSPKQSKPPVSKPDVYISENGFAIRVGRNNLQNDRLTLRQSDKQDLWLHVKDQPGSHVVIERGQAEEIPEETIEEAALLAAYFSRGRDSATVPVDITEIRHVWKPNGARPGFVLYDHHRTLFVTPDRNVLDAILRRRQNDDRQAGGG